MKHIIIFVMTENSVIIYRAQFLFLVPPLASTMLKVRLPKIVLIQLSPAKHWCCVFKISGYSNRFKF